MRHVPVASAWLSCVLLSLSTFYAVNGHVYPQVDDAKIGIFFREPGQLFLNQRDGAFRDVSDQVGPALKVPRVGRGLAIGDLFNDGAQEVVVENLEGEPVIFRPRGRTAQSLDWLRTRRNEEQPARPERPCPNYRRGSRPNRRSAEFRQLPLAERPPPALRACGRFPRR